MTDEAIRLTMALATLGFSCVGLVFAVLALREALKIRRERKNRGH